MDGEHWFDALNRALATSGSRKAFLKLAGATLAGLLLADPPMAEAQATPGVPCRSSGDCPNRGLCLGGRCCPYPRGCQINVPGGPPGRTRSLCCNPGLACVIPAPGSLTCCPRERFCQDRQGVRRCCPSGSSCQGGRCICRATGRPACGNACCPSGKVCENGRCVGCPIGQQRCNGTCCRCGETCRNGRCVPETGFCSTPGEVPKWCFFTPPAAGPVGRCVGLCCRPGTECCPGSVVLGCCRPDELCTPQGCIPTGT